MGLPVPARKNSEHIVQKPVDYGDNTDSLSVVFATCQTEQGRQKMVFGTINFQGCKALCINRGSLFMGQNGLSMSSLSSVLLYESEHNRVSGIWENGLCENS